MRECPHCLSDILSEAETRCPSCGVALVPAGKARAAPLGGAAQPAAPEAELLGEETLLFRRQFEERAVRLPASVLRRAEQILAAAQT